MRFRATLNFRNFKVTLNLRYRIFSNYAKSCILSCLSKVYKKKKFHRVVFEYKHLNLKLRVFLAGHSVAMVTYSEMKMLLTYSPVIEQFFDIMI